MAYCILFVLPPDSLVHYAKAALKPIPDRLQKSIIRQTRREASVKIHTLDLGELETTQESFQGDSTIKNFENPLARKIHTTTLPAQCLQLDRVWLVLDWWVLYGSVPGRLPSANNIAGLGSLTRDLICRKRDNYRGLLGFTIGNQWVFKGTSALSPVHSVSGTANDETGVVPRYL